MLRTAGAFIVFCACLVDAEPWVEFPGLDTIAFKEGMRRLQDSSSACLSACPSMHAAGLALSNLSSAGSDYPKQMAILCPHIDAVICMTTNTPCTTFDPTLASQATAMQGFKKLCSAGPPGSDSGTCVASCTTAPKDCASQEAMLNGCASSCSSQTKAYFRAQLSMLLNVDCRKATTSMASLNHPGLGALIVMTMVWIWYEN